MRMTLGLALTLGASLAACDNEKPRPKFGVKYWAPANAAIQKLASLATAAHAATGAFPRGVAAILPAAGHQYGDDCCWGTDFKCPVSDAWAKDPVWSALKFQLAEPSAFRYTYESDGTTARVRAIGDQDCDTKMLELVLDLSVVDGTVKTSITEPNPRDD